MQFSHQNSAGFENHPTLTTSHGIPHAHSQQILTQPLNPYIVKHDIQHTIKSVNVTCD